MPRSAASFHRDGADGATDASRGVDALGAPGATAGGTPRCIAPGSRPGRCFRSWPVTAAGAPSGDPHARASRRPPTGRSAGRSASSSANGVTAILIEAGDGRCGRGDGRWRYPRRTVHPAPCTGERRNAEVVRPTDHPARSRRRPADRDAPTRRAGTRPWTARLPGSGRRSRRRDPPRSGSSAARRPPTS